MLKRRTRRTSATKSCWFKSASCVCTWSTNSNWRVNGAPTRPPIACESSVVPPPPPSPPAPPEPPPPPPPALLLSILSLRCRLLPSRSSACKRGGVPLVNQSVSVGPRCVRVQHVATGLRSGPALCSPGVNCCAQSVDNTEHTQRKGEDTTPTRERTHYGVRCARRQTHKSYLSSGAKTMSLMLGNRSFSPSLHSRWAASRLPSCRSIVTRKYRTWSWPRCSSVPPLDWSNGGSQAARQAEPDSQALNQSWKSEEHLTNTHMSQSNRRHHHHHVLLQLSCAQPVAHSITHALTHPHTHESGFD